MKPKNLQDRIEMIKFIRSQISQSYMYIEVLDHKAELFIIDEDLSRLLLLYCMNSAPSPSVVETLILFNKVPYHGPFVAGSSQLARVHFHHSYWLRYSW